MSYPDLRNRRQLLDSAQAVLDCARQAVLDFLARGYRVERKSDGSFVTEADLESERVLREQLAARFPEHGILGEELPPHHPEADFQWILDPIDGTHSFSRGVPLYGILLALEHQGEPVLGLIDLPGLKQRYAAARGLGAWCGGERLRLADSPDLEAEIVATGDRGQFVRVGELECFERLFRELPRVRTYADCFGHALTLSGAVGTMVDYGLRKWDVAPTRVLVEEAGGRFELLPCPDPDFYNAVFGKSNVVERVLSLCRPPRSA